MFRFLSKFHLATRVYGGFLLVGAYVVFLCFFAMTAVGTVQKEYTKANAVMNATRQLTALETDFYALDQALFFFSKQRSAAEKKKTDAAFRRFFDKAGEVEMVLGGSDLDDRYKKVVSEIAARNRSAQSDMNALYDKSVEADKKVEKYAGQSSEKLTAMIEEVSLPSASFALNNLREQLDEVLSLEAAVADSGEDRKRLTDGLAALKKAVNSAKQAEMVNTKQLKVVSASLKALEDEINRKLKINDTLRTKIKNLSSNGKKTVAEFNGLLDDLGAIAADFIAKAENDKIRLQKLFVFCAAFGGVFAVLMSFLSLYGIRYPLNRLVDCATEIARGNRSVLIHFTERGDEVGALARSLSTLLAHLKDLPVLSDTSLLGRPDTYGAPVSYVPLGAPNMNGDAVKNESEVAYFGQGVGVDTESQLCQMLGLLQQLSSSASEMSEDSKERFGQCQTQLATMAEALNFVRRGLEALKTRLDENDYENLKTDLKRLFEFLQVSAPELQTFKAAADAAAQASGQSMQNAEQAKNFVKSLQDWIRSTLDEAAQMQNAAAETKILALNASIEAAKAGDKAKSFGAVALDIRRQTQKTEDAVARLSDRLKAVRQGASGFSDIVARLEQDTADSTQKAAGISAAAQEQRARIEGALHALQSAGIETEKLQSVRQDALSDLNELPAHLGDAEELIPFLERQLNAISKKFEDYVAVLPTYEEEKDPL